VAALSGGGGVLGAGAAALGGTEAAVDGHGAQDQGLTLAHFTAQLEDLPDTSLTSELNLGTFGTHPRINLGHVRDKVSLS